MFSGSNPKLEHATRRVSYKTYVAQLVEVLNLYGSLTPHLPGRVAAALGFKPRTEPAAPFKQLQAALRSGVVWATALSLLTPPQHCGEGPRPLVR